MMMNKYLTLSLGLLMLAGSVHAAGDVARGKAKSVTCAACHGADGNSAVATFPKLAGQNVDYLVHSLTAYKKGTRKNAMMSPMAAPLSASEIEDLAAYFASQSALTQKK
ncbi:cytochrome c [Uliginosibacterium sp. H3]|uniref:Cytochrome c n=1 Tax=Uliginosibacterium silvisoli TaxID=3114758 RepID=A0ABU6K6B1_9RHOO|nr:cytochrome c [Uliginosibacterium sp. H3]